MDTRNDCILCISDTSIYDQSCLKIECPYLDVLVPGYKCAVRIEVTPGFCNLCLTACDLELQIENCGKTFNSLPDGVYAIKYSVSPNEHVFVEYNYLRITEALNEINKTYCNLNLSGGEPLETEKIKLNKLRYIETLIKAAKAKVEYCHSPKEGMDLYNFALKKLKKLTCSNC